MKQIILIMFGITIWAITLNFLEKNWLNVLGGFGVGLVLLNYFLDYNRISGISGDSG